MVERIASDRASRRGRFWKIAAAVIAVAAVVILFVNRFYHTVQAPYWNALDRAEIAAAERAGIQQTSVVERFVGDQPYSIVHGTDEEGVPVIVWLWGEDGVHVERQDAGITREQAEDAARLLRPDMHVLRVTAGRLREEYVWEVFSETSSPEGRRKYYDFLRFRDGALLETYRLALERN